MNLTLFSTKNIPDNCLFDFWFFCQCAGVWHFPWSRNACGIYWSLQLYIPNTCMPCRIFGYFLLPSDDTAASESWSVTALTQCTCQASAVTLCFSQWLFNSPLTCWHFRWDRPFLFLFFFFCSIVSASIHSHSLSPACLIGAVCSFWTPTLLPSGMAGHCQWAHCSFAGRLCHLKTSKHPFNASRADFVVSVE